MRSANSAESKSWLYLKLYQRFTVSLIFLFSSPQRLFFRKQVFEPNLSQSIRLLLFCSQLVPVFKRSQIFMKLHTSSSKISRGLTGWCNCSVHIFVSIDIDTDTFYFIFRCHPRCNKYSSQSCTSSPGHSAGLERHLNFLQYLVHLDKCYYFVCQNA